MLGGLVDDVPCADGAVGREGLDLQKSHGFNRGNDWLPQRFETVVLLRTARRTSWMRIVVFKCANLRWRGG